MGYGLPPWPLLLASFLPQIPSHSFGYMSAALVRIRLPSLCWDICRINAPQRHPNATLLSLQYYLRTSRVRSATHTPIALIATKSVGPFRYPRCRRLPPRLGSWHHISSAAIAQSEAKSLASSRLSTAGRFRINAWRPAVQCLVNRPGHVVIPSFSSHDVFERAVRVDECPQRVPGEVIWSTYLGRA